MKNYLCLLFGLCLLTLPTKAWQAEKGGTSPTTGGTLHVKLQYTGSGTVDEKHKIFVVLFDSPDFQQGGAMPISVQSATAKDATVTFSDLTASPVYAAASYDPSGNYDGQSGPPPSGASLGMYSKTPGKPAPIDVPAGKTVQVTLSFGDSAKMP